MGASWNETGSKLRGSRGGGDGAGAGWSTTDTVGIILAREELATKNFAFSELFFR